MTNSKSLTLFLAAGKGTRMRSSLPKVLHPIAGRSMLHHVMAAAGQNAGDKAIVIGPDMDNVAEAATAFDDNTKTYIQADQLGTAHAVLAARPAIEKAEGEVIILYGDTPLLTDETVEGLRTTLKEGADLVVLGFEAADPTGYGRLLTDADGNLVAIREHKDATEDEQDVTFCNSGVFGFRAQVILGLLDRIGNDNAKNEYYLTDAVELARQDGLRVVAVACEEEEVMGVNSRTELADAEAIMQWQLREGAMEAGVTLTAPETVMFNHDIKLSPDITIEPNVVFGEGVEIGEGATIRAFSHIEGARIAPGAIVGPYARLRPGANIGRNAKIGNFVEIKAADIEEGAKVNHLTYIGNARVGEKANVGAGTITCNYDGYDKHHTDIGAGAFIGSNSALVAPVKIGDNAIVGAGSVITKAVPPGALATTRPDLDQREQWATKFHARRSREKSKPKV